MGQNLSSLKKNVGPCHEHWRPQEQEGVPFPYTMGGYHKGVYNKTMNHRFASSSFIGVEPMLNACNVSVFRKLIKKKK
jgi:hypothetical protein